MTPLGGSWDLVLEVSAIQDISSIAAPSTLKPQHL